MLFHNRKQPQQKSTQKNLNGGLNVLMRSEKNLDLMLGEKSQDN